MIYFVSNTNSLSSSFQSCTIDDVVVYCADKEVLGVDTETEGFDFTCKKMIMFQIGDKENQFIQSLQQTEWDVEIVMDSWFKNGHDGKLVMLTINIL